MPRPDPIMLMRGCRRLAMRTVLLTALFIVSVAPMTYAAPTEVVIARGGEAALPVVVAEDASDAVRAAADELADYLGRITGGRFSVETGDGRTGIAVGTLEAFPDLGLDSRFDAQGLARREQYLLHSHAEGVHVVGATELAVQHAVWDLLYHLGHRQFFPGETWEVVPNDPDLTVAVDVTEAPDYFDRRIWYTYGLQDHNEKPYQQWLERNRGVGGFTLRTPHVWREIYERHKDVFDQNPQFLALVDGKREYLGTGTKFCLSQPALRQLIVDDRVAEMAQNPDMDSITIEPSDYDYWCECDACAAMGSISDRVVILANEAAEAIVDRFGPERYVAFYAYHEHSPPPSVRVHPNVIVSIATMFIRGGYTAEDLFRGWGRFGTMLGLREYYARDITSHDLPGNAPITNLTFIRESIPAYHSMGARFLSGQSVDAWGAYGLGYYIATRIMWDLDEADRVEALVDDFLTRAFGDAREPMGRFFALSYHDRPTLLSEDLVGRMYRLLDEASRATTDPAVQARLDDLILYTRYVDLYRQYDASSGDQRLENMGRMLSHSYRIRHRMMTHVRAHFQSLSRRDRNVTRPPEVLWDVPEGENPWKSQEPPYTRSEIDAMLADGIARHQLATFEPRSFSSDLVPAADHLELPAGSTDRPTFRTLYNAVFYTWADTPSSTVEVQASGGLIESNRDRGDVRVQLYPAASPDNLPSDQTTVPPDGEPRDVTLQANEPGLHRLTISDGGSQTRLRFDGDMPLTFEMSSNYVPRFSGSVTAYFFVPRDTPVLAGYHDGGGTIHDADGEAVLAFDGRSGYFEVPVPADQAGRIWSLRGFTGYPRLMTVPPYASLDPRGLMLPREVLGR